MGTTNIQYSLSKTHVNCEDKIVLYYLLSMIGIELLQIPAL
jgi:hypothetical protein